MKYFLHDTEFIQSFDNPEDIITWIYKWDGQTAWSTAMIELLELNYFEN